MDKNYIFLNIVITLVALGILYLVIKAAVRNGMREFLRDVAPPESEHAGHETSARMERLAARLAEVTRRDPADPPSS
ncbi:hypothetical protein [Actinoplanes sp. NPDC049265]|uniref:hypothetical protein n=1 Tax=Actinoplanes sp. NPDC049265 TaxID=3363902 RepID=UPI0037218A67